MWLWKMLQPEYNRHATCCVWVLFESFQIPINFVWMASTQPESIMSYLYHLFAMFNQKKNQRNKTTIEQIWKLNNLTIFCCCCFIWKCRNANLLAQYLLEIQGKQYHKIEGNNIKSLLLFRWLFRLLRINSALFYCLIWWFVFVHSHFSPKIVFPRWA